MPTREEIQRKIDQHRQSRKAPRFGENMSMASAFQGGMGSLVEAVGGEMGVHLAIARPRDGGERGEPAVARPAEFRGGNREMH